MEKERTEAEKAKAKRIHKAIMTVCGSGMALSGIIAAYLLFTAGSVPNFFFGLISTASPKTYRLPSAPDPAPPVNWRPFADSSFEEAKRRNTLVLLNLTNFYCHACRLMDELVYRDPELKEWIEANLVPIKADMDERPDLLGRYQAKNWPTTALLLPTQELVSEGSFVPKERFLPWARQILQTYKAKPHAFEEARANARLRREEAQKRLEEAARDRARALSDEERLKRDFEKLKTLYDADHGGFGRDRKFFQPDAYDTLFKTYEATKDPQALSMLEKTFQGQLKLQDPVSGGLFRCANKPDWSEPEYEMLLSVNRQAVKDWERFLKYKDDPGLRAAAERVKRFIETSLKEPKSRKYHLALTADAQRPEGGWIHGADYYRSSEHNRRAARPLKHRILVP